MGLLDDLKMKAEQARSQEPAPDTDGPPQDPVGLRQLRARLKALFCYLQELVQHLRVVPLETSVSFSLPGNISTPRMPLQNFTLTADASDRMSEIRFRCEAVAERPIFIPARTEKEAVEIGDGLKTFGLVFAKRTAARSGHRALCIYEVSPRFPINYVFRLDPVREGMHLLLRNHGELGIRKEFFSLEELDEDWMEAVGALVIHKDAGLLDRTHSHAERDRIRSRLSSVRSEEIGEQLDEIEEVIERRKPRSAWELLFRSGKTPPDRK
ncbi:MAG: hypothetical protein KJ558_01575 [Gammaproteobacteria bacterium]|nr:hypothetical protein [Gammaproteobacteria bacterium]MBU1653527.1 hypothetical protein [Gammaproteobacteria bacterium]MBU1962556.1 hypothetical protein [Gammaproteobacteria bacterium]